MYFSIYLLAEPNRLLKKCHLTIKLLSIKKVFL